MFERIEAMFTTTTVQNHGSVWTVLFIGVLFGMILQYSRIVKFEKIAGFAMLRDTVIPKMILLAVGLASVMIYFLVDFHYATYHIKPFNVVGIVVGGVLFGASMAIFGKCPGTGPISIAEGRIDVLVGAIGGVLGGLVFTLFYEDIKPLFFDISYGKMTLLEIGGGTLLLTFGVVAVIASFLIPLKEEEDEIENELIKEKK